MSSGDNLQQAYPQNTHKQDWAFYDFLGGKGAGGTIPATGVTRYSFWIDFDPFDIKNLKMLSQNLSFQIFSDNAGTVPSIPYFIIDQSNDITDELVKTVTPGLTAGTTQGLGTASIGLPPNGFVDDNTTQYITGNPQTSSTNAILVNDLTVTSAPGGSLVTGTTYYYAVSTVDGSGIEGLKSNVASYTADGVNNQVVLQWTAPVGAVYYTLYRNITSNFADPTTVVLTLNFFLGQPPYYNNTIFTSQPASGSFRNDQGNWTLKGYQNSGFGFGGTNMVAQGFVPQQSQLTGFFLGAIFHTNTNDHTKFYAINFELWDTNKTFITHLGTLQPTYDATVQPSGLTTDASCTAFCNNLSYNIGDDGINYWVSLTQPTLKLTNPVSVTSGQTYYIVLRLTPLSTTNYYFLGMNIDSTSTRSNLYYYPYANAYSAADGSSTWSTLVDANSKPITFPFVTQGNVGRYAVTFWWASLPTQYWPAPPSGKEYNFLHVDFNQRI